MPSFWKHVNRVLQEADIIIEVLDARMINETRNSEIEYKARKLNKLILYAINKCDLADKNELEKVKRTLKPSVFISSKEHLGTTLLKKKILELSKGEKVVVGVVGYPNVGKSSLINALSGRGAAKTSAESGYTKGLQKIKVDNKILVLDTPGVFPKNENDTLKYGKIGAIDYAKIKEPEIAALTLIEENKELILKYYQVDGDDIEEILEKIGLKLKKFGRKGEVDLEATSRLILKAWQIGKIMK